jgi:hypothetical protein
MTKDQQEDVIRPFNTPTQEWLRQSVKQFRKNVPQAHC